MSNKTNHQRMQALGLDPRNHDEAVGRVLTVAEQALGPKCSDEDCPDYDGEHPFHMKEAVKLHQSLNELSIARERLREIMAEYEKDHKVGTFLPSVFPCAMTLNFQTLSLRSRLSIIWHALIRKPCIWNATVSTPKGES